MSHTIENYGDSPTYEPMDPELRRSLTVGGQTDDAIIRNAFLLLEDRMRSAAGLPEHVFGAELADAVFQPDKGILQPFSSIGAERKGLHELFHGAFMFYRNPVSHRYVYHSQRSRSFVINLVDHLLHLIDQAVDTSVRIDSFVRRHEGRILKRRDFRLDIDSDDENEVLILLEMSPTARKGDEAFTSYFITVVLDQVKGQLRRIPTDRVAGTSMYGPHDVVPIRITNGERPDLRVSWLVGENGIAHFVFRWEEGSYKIVRLLRIRDEGEPSYSVGFYDYEYQQVQFVDFDGDGTVEVIQDFFLHGLPDESQAGLPEVTTNHEVNSRCEIWKWDDEKGCMIVVDQTTVAVRRHSVVCMDHTNGS